MTVDLYITEKGKITVTHDLNFQGKEYAKYAKEYPITFKNPSQALQARLRETGPLPTDGDGRLKKKGGIGFGFGAGAGAGVSNGRFQQQRDPDHERMLAGLESLAEDGMSLVSLPEDDVVQMIQMINDYRSDDMLVRIEYDGKSFSAPHRTAPHRTASHRTVGMGEDDG